MKEGEGASSTVMPDVPPRRVKQRGVAMDVRWQSLLSAQQGHLGVVGHAPALLTEDQLSDE
jgi:hypothetical protein